MLRSQRKVQVDTDSEKRPLFSAMIFNVAEQFVIATLKPFPSPCLDIGSIIYCFGNKRKEKQSYQLIVLTVGGSRCLATIQHDASQKGKAPFAILLSSTMRDFTSAENADMQYMYSHANVKHVHSTSPNMMLISPGRILSLEESILNVVADKPDSSARAIATLVGAIASLTRSSGSYGNKVSLRYTHTSHSKVVRGYLVAYLIIFNHGQVRRTIPEVILRSPNFYTETL
ncbi:hypothetical protein TNCV_4513941 [Trichonephila clavipes]|nr:hypothetical protein TNCV_4513941 [Trichonephila clavipes]